MTSEQMIKEILEMKIDKEIKAMAIDSIRNRPFPYKSLSQVFDFVAEVFENLTISSLISYDNYAPGYKKKYMLERAVSHARQAEKVKNIL